uniref:Uncharacterized protein n=1 Tax=Panagrolaimus davidi TaxID=227884 RepID=A0A914PHT6_9BILA
MLRFKTYLSGKCPASKSLTLSYEYNSSDEDEELIAPREQQHFEYFGRLFDPEGDNLIMTFPCSFQPKFKDFPLRG